jgi:hypothetical protein
MRRPSLREAYERLWSAILSGARVRQCRCGRSASCKVDVVALEREGWLWRLVAGRAAWTCPDCRPCGAVCDELRCTQAQGHRGVHFDDGAMMHFKRAEWRKEEEMRS